MKFIVVADDSFDTTQLSDDRQSVTQIAAPDEAMAILAGETFDVVVVDVVSSSPARLNFIRYRHEMARRIPLLALTGHHNEDRLRALRLGADDAVTQPVDAGELRVRCAALIRRKTSQSPSLIRYGSLSLLLESREVWYRNVSVSLTRKEYSILEVLALHQGDVVTLDAIMKRLYGGLDEPANGIISVFVTQLRKKLRKVGADHIIASVPRHGYQLRELGKPFPPPPSMLSMDIVNDSSLGDRPTTP
jgi:DNA-binding response OmpR family regulator